MKKTTFLVLSTLLVNLSIVSARCDTPTPQPSDSAVYLPKGGIAPFNGYEITPTQAEKVRDNKIDLSTQTKLNADMTQENALLNERLTNAQQQNESLSKQLVETKDSGLFAKIGLFVLGAGVTGLISYGIYRTK